MDCELIESFFDIFDMIVDEQRTPRDYGDAHLLYHSELNFIDAIHKYPEANAGKLSEVLGITQGAITQVANKLIRRKLIEGYANKGNKKNKYYRLTPEGESVIQGHQDYHEEANRKLCQYFCSLSADEAAVILRLFAQIKECMPVSVFACQANDGCRNSAARKKEL